MKVTVMKGRKQKISLHQRPVAQNNRTASESYATGQTFLWITENNLTEHDSRKTNGLLEDILSPSNLNAAYKRVKSNHGAAGVDKMEVESLKDYFVENKDVLIESILRGKYRPQSDTKGIYTQRKREAAPAGYHHSSRPCYPTEHCSKAVSDL